MKIIETYNDISLNTDSKKLIYNKMHDKMHQAIILNLLPNGKSVWIDSCGDGVNSDIVAFENEKWQGIFDSSTIKYYKEFNSPTLVQAINKYINPLSVVIYQSDEFKYINEQELINKINLLVKSYSTKLLIYIDIIFIDFNKLKYSNQHIIENTKKHINQNTTVHTIDNFKYIFEIN
jgi:hypothetical protein